MAHELAGALQQAGRIRERCAMKEPHVYVRSEYIDVAERRISQTCNRTAVMQELSDFVPAFSHHLKPLMRDGSRLTFMLFHPRVDGGIPLHSAVESQQFRSHRRSTFAKAALFIEQRKGRSKNPMRDNRNSVRHHPQPRRHLVRSQFMSAARAELVRRAHGPEARPASRRQLVV